MRKHIRFTALLLAVSLLLNTAVFPAAGEGSLDSDSVVETTAAVDETVAETTEPVAETTAPVVKASAPAQETTAPVAEATVPVVETAAPVVETTAPVVETTASVVETTAPVVETTTPAQETTAPVVETTAPAQETTAPSDETTAPAQETTAPSDETTAPTQETTAPTQEPETIIDFGYVVCDTSVNIRSGPGTDYAILDSAYNDQRVDIYEIVQLPDANWGRIGEGRWICLTYVQLNSQKTPTPTEEPSAPSENPPEKPTAPTKAPETIIDSGHVVCDTSVNIRSGPGTNYSILDSAYNDQRVNIYEIVQLSDANWGRIGEGRWICLTYVQLNSQKAPAPTEETTVPSEVATVPSEETTDPTEETTDPSEEATDPTEETTDPSEETTDPSEETTDPSEEATDPTEDATDPSEEATDPTEETTDPQELLTAELEAILSSKVVPQQMSLTWWAARCGKLDTADFLADDGNEDAEGLPPALHFEPKDNTLQISSAQELFLLSYVEPQAYCSLSLTLYPSSEEDAGFNLLTGLDGLGFLGLGSEEYPFRGEILFTEQTGSILLNQPLFNALSDDAKITGLSLESYVQGIAEGGLLAKTVTHDQGGNIWKITLTQPEPEEDTIVNLPPLVFNLANNADVSLEVNDLSGLQVLGSGFVCAVMGENARLSLSGIRAIPSVIGYSDAVGGLVGLMKSGASLTVNGESISVRGVSGNWNVGGIVGSATDPLLSLPPVVGSDGTVVRGENVGGLIGRLSYTQGEHALALSLSGLTLEGSINAGGLFGVLQRDAGTLLLDAQVDGTVFADGAENAGSLMGTYHANSLEDPLILSGEPISDEAGYEALAGLVDYPDKPQETEPEVTEPEEASSETTEPQQPQTEESTVHIFTVEEAQAILDSILDTEVKPGEMSLLWWAVANGKITAEDLAAELNAIHSSNTETTPETEASTEAESTEAPEATQESESAEESETTEATVESETTEAAEVPTESAATVVTEAPTEAAITVVTEAPTEAETTAVTEAPAEAETTAITEAQEANDLPQETTQGEAEERTQEDILTQEDVLLMKYANLVPMVSMEEESSSASQPDESAIEYGIMLLNELTEEDLAKYLTIESAANLVSLSVDVLAQQYQDKTITIKSGESSGNNVYDVNDQSFSGLGSEEYPFTGKLVFSNAGNTNVQFRLNRALFNYLDDSATINVNLYSNVTNDPGEGYLSSILAENITHNITHKPGLETPNTWKIGLCAALYTNSDITRAYSPTLVGTMAEGSKVSMDLELTVGSIPSSGDYASIVKDSDYRQLTILGSGYLCNTMGVGAQLTANLSAAGDQAVVGIPAVKSDKDKNAGGLVGTMGSGAQLTVTGNTSLPISSVTAQGTGNAGGLVGEATNPVLNLPAITAPSGTSISGTNAGGLIGNLTLNGETNSETPTKISIASPINGLTIKASNSAGGLYGELHSTGNRSIEGISVSDITFDNPGKQSAAGGIIGRYKAKGLNDSLTIKDVTAASTSTYTSSEITTWAYGGIIGYLEATPAYIEFQGVTITTGGKVKNHGGLIGELSNSGHMVRVIGSTPASGTGEGSTEGESSTTAGSIAVTSSCVGTDSMGGLVGYMPNGVLYIQDSEPTLSLTALTSSPAKSRGWIVGKRGYDSTHIGNALVYTDAADWIDDKGSYTNDIGAWGQVLRVGSGSPISDLISFSEENHKVTVDAAKTDNTISDVKDFAAIALRILFDDDNSDSLVFTGGDIAITDSVSITITGDVDLTGTGLTGLTRDFSFDKQYNYTITGRLKEDKTAPKITLPNLKVYAAENSHNRQGLIGIAKGATISNLTVATPDDESSLGITVHVLEKGTYSGIVAELAGGITLNNVTSSVKWNITQSNGDCRFGGMVGQNNTESKALSFTNCTWDGSITVREGATASVGGFLARSNANNTSMSFTSCKVFGSVSAPGGTPEAGGLVGVIWDKTGNTISINDLQVKASIDVKGNSCGLLGFQWWQTTVLFSGVQVYESSLNSHGNAFGGLVYRGSGFWKVSGNSETPGISFQLQNSSNTKNTFTSTYSNTETSALIVCHGEKLFADKGALYLEIGPDAYQIDPTAIDLDGVSSSNFDEIIGITEGSNGNGIVSYGITGNARFDQGDTATTYVNRVATGKTNKNARYYYNLDLFRSRFTQNSTIGSDYGKLTGAFGDIDTSEKMVLWSAWSHADNSIKQYFINGDHGVVTNPTTTLQDVPTTLDLRGYSFYPVPFDGTVIQDATITFDYDNLMTKENGNKLPSENTSQHYEMHTGIFTDADFARKDSATSLSVKHLTLQGSVGGSAIIKGKAAGVSPTKLLQLTLEDITLDGISSKDSSGALCPVLIGSIGSYSALEMTKVLTTEKYKSSQTADGKPFFASSLIGDIGGENASNIQLTFSDMRLDGRTKYDAVNLVHGTHYTIFEDALFATKFQYSGTSRGVYNFRDTEKGTCTYGQELSNSATGSVSGRNNDNQFCFYDSTEYVCGTNNDDTAKTYFVDYRRYVVNTEDATGTLHELDINQISPDMIKGCGTYSDPYIIEHGAQLKALQDLLYSDQMVNKDWKVKLNTLVLDAGNTVNFASTAENAQHTRYEGSETAEAPVEGDPDRVFTCTDSGWTSTGEAPRDLGAVRTYLRNAYYKLVGDETKVIKLGSDWNGLGEPTFGKAFSGVIVGGEGVTVHIEKSSATQFGGLIKCSQGSVVKDVTIVYEKPISVSYAANSVPSNTGAPFFGGVVGWCIGGDTIIDNVTVTYKKQPQVTKNYYLAAVGGYVGLVGGAVGVDGFGGGVVFKGNVSSSLTSDNFLGTSNYFYCNPYVGRVLDGYAMKEGTEGAKGVLDNTDKNYQIPVIDTKNASLSQNKTTGAIEIENEQELWLLSAIVNSGSGNLSGIEAYSTGKPRTCKYEGIGSSLNNDYTKLADEAYLGGVDAPSKTKSYLLRYLDSYEALTSGVNITITKDCNMSTYGNGFRGIGGCYQAVGSTSRLLQLASLDGGNKIITLGQDRKEYIDEKNSWTSIGTGLIVALTPTSDVTISNLVLTGNTGISYHSASGAVTDISYNNTTSWDQDNASRIKDVSAAALLSSLRCSSNITFTIENVRLETMNINQKKDDEKKYLIRGSRHAGGLIGNTNCDGTVTLNVKDCSYDTLKTAGQTNVGGFLGYVKATTASISFSKNTLLKDGVITSTCIAPTKTVLFGFGGLVGYNDGAELSIAPKSGSAFQMTLQGLTIEGKINSSDANDTVFCGGLVGLWIAGSTSSTIKNVNLEGDIKIIGGVDVSFNNQGQGSANSNITVGGLVGTLADNLSAWGSATNPDVTVTGINIAKTAGSVTITNTRQVGGLFGAIKAGGKIEFTDITMGTVNNKVTILNNSTMGAYQSLGGLIGSNHLVSDDISFSNIQLTNLDLLWHRNNSNRGAAVLFGFIQNSMTIKLSNVFLKQCKLVVDDKGSRAGLLYGYLDNAKAIYGTNLLAEDCFVGLPLNYNDKNKTYSVQDLLYANPTKEAISKWGETTIGLQIKTDTSSSYTPYSKILSQDTTTNHPSIGILGGNTNSKTVQLVGVSLQRCYTPAQDFGQNSTKAYAVRADYDGAAGGVASNVTSKPTLNLTGIGSLTGDGIGMVSKTVDGEPVTIPLAQKIFEDYNGTTLQDNRKYFNAGTAMKFFKDRPSSFSTFKTAGKNFIDNDGTTKWPEGLSDFPVLVINSNESSKADEIVKKYISLLTNEDWTALHFDSITGQTYEWKTNAFEKVDPVSLSVTKNTVSIKPGTYDNGNRRFTLLDVQYKDPANTSSIAYHLYIPVLVQRVLEFTFYASAKNSTTYVANEYTAGGNAAIGSNMDQMTALLTFEYLRSEKDWQAMVDNGENLLWNFDKAVWLNAFGKTKMPRGTRLTLVDRKDGDKAYTWTYDGSSDSLSFSNFISVSDGVTTWSWENVPLCDLLGLKEEAPAAGKKGKYVAQKSKTSASTLRIGTKYFRPSNVDDADDATCDIKVNLTENIQETYYLTIQTPLPSNPKDDTIYNFIIHCYSSLNLPKDKGGKVVYDMPTTRVNEESATANENRVVIGNFFTQEFTVCTEGSSLMSDTYNTITAHLTTTIKFTSETAKKDFEDYNGKLYRSFCINLKEYLPAASGVPFADGTTIKVGDGNPEPIKGGAYTHWVHTGQVSDDGWVVAEDRLYTQEISTKIVLTFTPTGIVTQFPARAQDEKDVGIRLNATSVLAMEEGLLERSNLRKSEEDQANLFYRDIVSVATLSYNAYDEAQANPQYSGLQNLGVNGLARDNGTISSVALYNCSQVVNVSEADSLNLSFQLYQKQNDGTYDGTYKDVTKLDSNPSYTDFLDILRSEISAEVIGGKGTVTLTGDSGYSLKLSNYDGHSPIKISIKLNVNTGNVEPGSGMEASGKPYFKYANYRLMLNAELIRADGSPIPGSGAHDFIIYTNAKILPELIKTIDTATP